MGAGSNDMAYLKRAASGVLHGECACTLYNKGKVVLTQFGYLSFLSLVCTIKHSGVPLPALDSSQIKNLIWLSKTLVNVTWDNTLLMKLSNRVEKSTKLR